MFKTYEKYRITKGLMSSDASYGNNGAFKIPHDKISNYFYTVIASNGEGWEHVSVSLISTTRKVDRCPTWPEMCYIKDLFWDGTDCVIQFHPPASEYVNNHQTCLHLWRPTKSIIPIPDSILVGIK